MTHRKIPATREAVFYLWHAPMPGGTEHDTLCGLEEAYRIANESHPGIDCPDCLALVGQ